MLILENGKEDPVAKMLLQNLSIGKEMERSQRKIRQQGEIQLARIKEVYNGRVYRDCLFTCFHFYPLFY